MQITDYIYGVQKLIFEGSNTKDYLKAWKLLSSVPRKRKRRRGRKKNPFTRFYTLDHFIYKGNLTPIAPRYLLSFRNVPILPESEIHYKGISEVEKLMVRSLVGFTGFLEHIFLCNDLSYFDALQISLENKGISFRNRFLYDIILYELARIHIGIDNYTSYKNAITVLQPLFLKSILHDPTYFPTVQIVSHALRMLPLDALKHFFFTLVEEAYELNLAKSRILIWDGQFEHANSSDNPPKGKGYSDPDAGFCKHNKRIYGVGYKVSTIYAYCGKRMIPVYCELFPGNQADSTVFRETFTHYFALGYELPLVIIADAGPYCLEILQWLFELGIVPLINARKNIKNHPIIKVSKHYYVNRDFIPSQWKLEEIRLLMNARTAIERQFSHITLVYHARRSNVRGLEMVSKHRYLILILDLLKILTAYKMGRPDLIGKTRIFSTSRGIDFYTFFPEVAKEHGFQLLLLESPRNPTFFKLR